MKKIFFLLFLLPTLLFAQDLTYARYIIDTLASPTFHGRGYSFSADSLAADFLEKELKKNRIKPIGTDYYQTFKINSNVFQGNMFVAFDKKELVAGQDYIVDSKMNSVSGSFKIFIIDKKIAFNEKKLKKIFDGDLSETFILIDTVGAKGYLNDYYTKLVNYGYYDVAGIITVSDNLTYVPSQINGGIPHIILKRDALPSKIKRIKVDIDAVLKTDYVTRNVIGYIRGQVDSFLLITAHYDHLGTMGTNVFFPGAHDNASGCAMVMSLAKYFGDIRCIPHYNLVFVFFSGEEIGLVGSKYFTENPPFELSKIRFVLNLDMMGSGDEGVRIVNSTIFTDEYKLMLDINQEYELLPQIKKRGAAKNSDHYYFYEKGVPSFFVYSLGYYKEYHNIYDTRENIPLPGFNNMYMLFREFIQKLHTI